MLQLKSSFKLFTLTASIINDLICNCNFFTAPESITSQKINFIICQSISKNPSSLPNYQLMFIICGIGLIVYREFDWFSNQWSYDGGTVWVSTWKLFENSIKFKIFKNECSLEFEGGKWRCTVNLQSFLKTIGMTYGCNNELSIN